MCIFIPDWQLNVYHFCKACGNDMSYGKNVIQVAINYVLIIFPVVKHQTFPMTLDISIPFNAALPCFYSSAIATFIAFMQEKTRKF